LSFPDLAYQALPLVDFQLPVARSLHRNSRTMWRESDLDRILA